MSTPYKNLHFELSQSPRCGVVNCIYVPEFALRADDPDYLGGTNRVGLFCRTHASQTYITGPDGDNGPTYIAAVEVAQAPPRYKCSAPNASAVANARLIAAAPDLLTALQALTDALPVHQPNAKILAAHNAALKAIARATGKE